MERLGPRRFAFSASSAGPSASTATQPTPVIDLDGPNAFDASPYLPQPTNDIPATETLDILQALCEQQSRGMLSANSTPALPPQPNVLPSNAKLFPDSPAKEPSAVGKDDLKEILRNNRLSSEATAEVPTPHEMTVTLLKHQRQALAWMLERERDDKPPGNPRGGILADDQGFGKTLSTIALIISDLASPSERSGRVGSLIVAPTSVLNQWADEFEDRIEAGFRPRVLLYHGRNRRKMAPLLLTHDVIITSYGVLTNEYPKVLERGEHKVPVSVRSPGPLFQLKWHRVILDEAQAIKNFRSDRCKAAIEINALHRWSLTGTPIQNTVDDVYAQFQYLGYVVTSSHKEWVAKYRNPLEGYGRYGQKKKDLMFKKFQSLLGVVLLRRAKEDKVDGKPILELPSKTITVRELKFTKTELQYYQGLELWSVRRMQNVGEAMNEYAFTYVTLLRLRQACNHPALCEWENQRKFSFSDEELDVVEIRMNTKCLFKQLPADVQKRLLVALGPESTADHAQQCPICMDLIMEDGIVTKCGHIFCTSDFEKWMSTNDTCPFCRTNLSNEDEYMSVAGVRKEVHALLRKKRREELSERKEESKETKKEPTKEIELIFSGKRPSEDDDELDEDRIVKKPHVEVKPEDQERESSGMVNNDTSDTMSDEEEIKPKKEEKSDQSSRSTKIRAVMEDLKKVMEDEIALNEEGYEYVRLDGTMSIRARDEAMQMFKTRSKCRLFLISLTAGSTGLNLTVANHVFLLDSWWNPAVEDQLAIDRVHRIGQTKPVYVTKYKVADTVENQILAIQERKRTIINGALGVEGLKMIGRRRASMGLLMSLFSDVAENVAQRALQENNLEHAEMANNTLEYARAFRRGGDDGWLVNG
ncbi:P-loop containing nucleoside triphosphate hydrolase [Gracilaria domingensis]|nr:P-loop containing nucleoside triphosphate hydrolase [Gracilaria domingensis]